MIISDRIWGAGRMGRAGRTAAWRPALVATLLWAVACPASAGRLDTGIVSVPPAVFRVCILPFYDVRGNTPADADLGSLLEAGLGGIPWMTLVPARTVYEAFYDLGGYPWLVKGVWEEGRDPQEAEAYTWLRERWLLRARARFPADYYVLGRVVPTGRSRTLVLELTEGKAPYPVDLTINETAETPEEIPDALARAATRITAFLETRWSEAYLEEVRRQYLGRMVTLETAVQEARKQVAAHPEMPVLRLLLLSLYQEDDQAYGQAAVETARELVKAWEAGDEMLARQADRLGVDPFLVLLEAQARRKDWNEVVRTCELAAPRNPLRSGDYAKWCALAEARIQGRGRLP